MALLVISPGCINTFIHFAAMMSRAMSTGWVSACDWVSVMVKAGFLSKTRLRFGLTLTPSVGSYKFSKDVPMVVLESFGKVCLSSGRCFCGSDPIDASLFVHWVVFLCLL